MNVPIFKTGIGFRNLSFIKITGPGLTVSEKGLRPGGWRSSVLNLHFARTPMPIKGAATVTTENTYMAGIVDIAEITETVLNRISNSIGHPFGTK